MRSMKSAWFSTRRRLSSTVSTSHLGERFPIESGLKTTPLMLKISDFRCCVIDLNEEKKDKYFILWVRWKLTNLWGIDIKKNKLRNLEIFSEFGDLSQQRKRELGFCIYNGFFRNIYRFRKEKIIIWKDK